MRILVAEDDEGLRDVLVLGLTDAGYHVDAVERGDDAIDQLRWYDYDVAVIDWRMPGAEGIDVVAWARRNDRPTGLLMLTARTRRPTGSAASTPAPTTTSSSRSTSASCSPGSAPSSAGRAASTRRSSASAASRSTRSAGWSRSAARSARLTATEYRILELLLRRAPAVVDRKAIAEHAWADETDPLGTQRDRRPAQPAAREAARRGDPDRHRPRRRATAWRPRDRGPRPGRPQPVHPGRPVARRCVVGVAYLVIALAVIVFATQDLTGQVDQRLAEALERVPPQGIPDDPRTARQRARLPGPRPRPPLRRAVPAVARHGPGHGDQRRQHARAARGAGSRSPAPVTATIDGFEMRVAGADVANGRVIVAQSMEQVTDAQRTIVLSTLLIAPFLLGSVFVGAVIVGRRVAAPIEAARRRQLEFTADASHELRTPLSVIEAHTTLALAQDREAAWYRGAFTRVDRRGEADAPPARGHALARAVRCRGHAPRAGARGPGHARAPGRRPLRAGGRDPAPGARAGGAGRARRWSRRRRTSWTAWSACWSTTPASTRPRAAASRSPSRPSRVAGSCSPSTTPGRACGTRTATGSSTGSTARATSSDAGGAGLGPRDRRRDHAGDRRPLDGRGLAPRRRPVRRELAARLARGAEAGAVTRATGAARRLAPWTPTRRASCRPTSPT